mmetsp:Transcript_23351/g.61323  ORF Transcript_23351/g.61323 Transcript_23351/m.61323 type:complete len:264 (+) Transcript_23351:754-1545(+)
MVVSRQRLIQRADADPSVERCEAVPITHDRCGVLGEVVPLAGEISGNQTEEQLNSDVDQQTDEQNAICHKPDARETEEKGRVPDGFPEVVVRGHVSANIPSASSGSKSFCAPQRPTESAAYVDGVRGSRRHSIGHLASMGFCRHGGRPIRLVRHDPIDRLELHLVLDLPSRQADAVASDEILCQSEVRDRGVDSLGHLVQPRRAGSHAHRLNLLGEVLDTLDKIVQAGCPNCSERSQIFIVVHGAGLDQRIRCRIAWGSACLN